MKPGVRRRRAWSQSKSTASPPKGSESITAVSFIPRRTRQTTKKTGIVITELKPISAYLIVDGWGVVKESRAENCAERICAQRIARRELRVKLRQNCAQNCAQDCARNCAARHLLAVEHARVVRVHRPERRHQRLVVLQQPVDHLALRDPELVLGDAVPVAKKV